MEIGVARSLQLFLSVVLLISALCLYLAVFDWWIYAVPCIAGGVLNLFPHSGCPFWRFLASALIVLGTIETLFLVWSIRLVEQSPFFTASGDASARHELFEGRLILLPALAVSLTLSTRLGTAKHEGILDALRTLLLLCFGLSLMPAFAYSATFFVPSLADIVTHYLEKVPF